MQVVNLDCACCKKRIALDRDGRACPRCSKPFHVRCIPASNACPECGATLVAADDANPRVADGSVRPIPVTVVAWLLIVMGVLVLVFSPFILNGPTGKQPMAGSALPIAVQAVQIYVGCIVSITCGIYMLSGRNWARLLYVGLTALGFILAFATSPAKLMLLPGFALYVVITILLFLPRSNAYFSGRRQPDAE